MTGRRLLRIILGLVAANVVGVVFYSTDKVGLPSRAQEWFYGFVVMAILAKSRSRSDGDGDCGRMFLAKPFLQSMEISCGGVITSLDACVPVTFDARD